MNINILEGKILKDILRNNNDSILFVVSDTEKYLMWHSQSCCESVEIDDIFGDLNDLIGSKIIRATEDTNSDNLKEKNEDSWTWTFYNITSEKGSVTIKWYGSSNGYYSESVDFELQGATE